MSETLMTRREYRAIKENADRKALHAKYFKPIKVVTVFSLAAALVAGGSVSAMAATTDPTVPSMDQPLTADQMLGTPTLGEALTADQMSTALAAAPYETITGITGTPNDGLNIDVNMSDPSTNLQVNTIADDGQGHYKIEVDATGASAGFWTIAVGDTYTSSAGTETATVTAINGNIVSLDITYSIAPSVTPVFSVSGSSIGTAITITAPKGTSVAVDDNEVLDTTKQATATYDPLSNDIPSQGYVWDTASLLFVNPVTGATTTTQATSGATFSIANGVVNVTGIPNWSGFANLTYTANEKWAGAPGTEPAGWTPATISGQLKVQIIGATSAQPSASDCSVQATPAMGSGFSVPLAAVGTGPTACNLVAVADSVSIAPDATQGAVNVGANDTTTNSSYTVDPSSIQFRAPDGTFAADVIYPNQYELSYDSVSGQTTVTRLGSYSGSPTILYRVSESKLDSSNNRLVGGSSSALITMDFAPLTTPETPVTVPETPVTVPVVPETSVTDPVVTDIGIAITDNTPAPVTGSSDSRPFSNLGDSSAKFGGPTKTLPVVASATPQGLGNTVIGALGVGVLVLGLGAAGVVSISNARHRKSQKSDVAA